MRIFTTLIQRKDLSQMHFWNGNHRLHDKMLSIDFSKGLKKKVSAELLLILLNNLKSPHVDLFVGPKLFGWQDHLKKC